MELHESRPCDMCKQHNPNVTKYMKPRKMWLCQGCAAILGAKK